MTRATDGSTIQKENIRRNDGSSIGFPSDVGGQPICNKIAAWSRDFQAVEFRRAMALPARMRFVQVSTQLRVPCYWRYTQ